MATRTWKASVKLEGGYLQDVTIQADDAFRASKMIEAQYGQGCIISSPVQVRSPGIVEVGAGVGLGAMLSRWLAPKSEPDRGKTVDDESGKDVEEWCAETLRLLEQVKQAGLAEMPPTERLKWAYQLLKQVVEGERLLKKQLPDFEQSAVQQNINLLQQLAEELEKSAELKLKEDTPG